MVFLETNRTQIYRKYSPSQSSGERGVGLNTDGHGFNGRNYGHRYTRPGEDAKGGKNDLFKDLRKICF